MFPLIYISNGDAWTAALPADCTHIYGVTRQTRTTCVRSAVVLICRCKSAKTYALQIRGRGFRVVSHTFRSAESEGLMDPMKPVGHHRLDRRS
jgi:hypothetical protein